MPQLEIHQFDSAVLDRKRKIRVCLPDDYESQPDRRHSLLIQQDGQTAFAQRDEDLPYGSWGVDEWVDRLSRAGVVRPTIIVGIDNSPARMKEYFPVTHQFVQYQRFIVKELIPWLEDHYRLIPDQSERFLMGSSMGGLVSFALAFNHPEAFCAAACISPWFEYENNRYIHEVLREVNEMPPVRIYMDSGIHDWRGLDDGHRGMLLARLELHRLGRKEGPDFDWMVDTWFPDDEALAGSKVHPERHESAKRNQHNEFQWNRRLERPIRFLLGHPAQSTRIPIAPAATAPMMNRAPQGEDQ